MQCILEDTRGLNVCVQGTPLDGCGFMKCSLRQFLLWMHLEVLLSSDKSPSFHDNDFVSIALCERQLNALRFFLRPLPSSICLTISCFSSIQIERTLKSFDSNLIFNWKFAWLDSGWGAFNGSPCLWLKCPSILRSRRSITNLSIDGLINRFKSSSSFPSGWIFADQLLSRVGRLLRILWSVE